MAEAYPSSRFVGFDFHGPSIDAARERAAAAGVEDRVTFTQAAANDYAETGFDLVCFFDCLHDMGDPVGAARHAHRALADDGTVLLVEPFAGDRLEDNCNPVGRMFYAASTFICTPNSLSQDVGRALGAQAGEARLRDVFTEAGFTTLPARHRDAVQPDPRSPQVGRSGPAASTTCSSTNATVSDRPLAVLVTRGLQRPTHDLPRSQRSIGGTSSGHSLRKGHHPFKNAALRERDPASGHP